MTRVLILRSEPAASETAQNVKALGHQPILLPLKKCICKTDIKLPLSGGISGFVFTSANAVRCLKENAAIDDVHLKLPTFCVGSRTSEIVRQIGFSNITCGEGGGKSLAKHILSQHNSGKLATSIAAPLLYLTLDKRTPDLELALKNTSIFIKPMISYEMVDQISNESLKNALKSSHIDIVLFYAQSTVRRFFAIEDELPHNLFTNMQFGCLSKEIAGAVPGHFADQIVIAEKPNETHLLACIG